MLFRSGQIIASSDQTTRFQDEDFATVFAQAKEIGMRYIEPWEDEFKAAPAGYAPAWDSLFADFNAWADANFSQSVFTIDVEPSGHGSVSPSTTYVCDGDHVFFEIVPDSGYAIGDVVLDGTSIGAVASFSLTNIRDDHTVSTRFDAIAHVLDGAVSVSGDATDIDGATVSLVLGETVVGGGTVSGAIGRAHV